MSGYLFAIRRIARELWFLPAMFCAFALLVLVLAYASSSLLPAELARRESPFTVSAESLRNIFGIVASSMLAVAVFALSTLVNLLTTAAQTGSPRAVPMFSDNRAARTTISTFIGAFLFSIIGIFGLSSDIYGPGGRLILFGATALVVLAVVWSLIRWVREISVVGRIDEMTRRLERATADAMGHMGRDGLYGCMPPREPGGAVSKKVEAKTIGFIQNFDPQALQRLAAEQDLRIRVRAIPGDYVDHPGALADVSGQCSEAIAGKIRASFIIGKERSFESDPRYGLVVLADIARRALSPGVNDPGTAIHVLTVQSRLLAEWAVSDTGGGDRGDGRYDRVELAPLMPDRLLDVALRPILYDAARASPDVGHAFLRAISTLARVAPDAFANAAAEIATELADRCTSTMTNAADAEAMRKAALSIGQLPR